jgi:hypothetical protein
MVSFGGSKSRNKVSVGEPAEGSLPSIIMIVTGGYICSRSPVIGAPKGAGSRVDFHMCAMLTRCLPGAYAVVRPLRVGPASARTVGHAELLIPIWCE